VCRNAVTNAGLACLIDVVGLRALDVKATRITDIGLLDCIPEMPQLQELNISYLDISDRGLSALESITDLQRLNLRHTAVSNNAIVDLISQKAHTLSRLNLSNTVINDTALADFPEQMQLNSLSLEDTGITDEAVRHVARFHGLEYLQLDLTDVSDDGIRHLASLESLRELALFRTNVSDTSLVWLSDAKIEHLGIGKTSVTDAGMPALTDFSNLQSLDVQRTSIGDRGLRFLSQASKLRTLHIEDTQITNAGLSFLTGLSLRTLSLNFGVSDTGLNTLSQISSLKNLATWHNVESWKPIRRFESLDVLLIDDSVNDLSPLHKLWNLKFLLMAGKRFAPTEVARLRIAIPQCRIKLFHSIANAIEEFRNLSNDR
jgi:internalin A